jgi:hypothetical protein
MDWASVMTFLGLAIKVFEVGKPKERQALTVPPTTPAPYLNDAAIQCLSIVAIVAIVAIVVFATSRQSA